MIAFHIIQVTIVQTRISGAKLEGVTPPPQKKKIRIVWIGRANHLDWQGNQRF